MTSTSSTSEIFSRTSEHCLSYSSSYGAESLFDTNSETDSPGFFTSLYRAGGPYLCSLPATSASLTTAAGAGSPAARLALLEDTERLEEDVRKILRSERIGYQTVALVGRQSKINPEPYAVPTVVVDVERESHDSRDWRRVARQIHQHVASLHAGVSVELVDPSMEKLPRCSPVQATHRLFAEWPAMREQILHECSIWDWTSLGLWRYGRSPNPADNPITILVAIRYDSVREYHTERNRIEAICARYEARDVSILFLKDELKLCCGVSQVPIEICDAAALPGVSIGIHNSSAGSSTLGGAIQLQQHPGSEWRTLYLTCFHSVHPPLQHRGTLKHMDGAKQGFVRWEQSPANLNDQDLPTILRVDHPSNGDLVEAVNAEKSVLNEIKGDRFRNLESRIRAMRAGEDAFVTPREKQRYENNLKSIEIFQHRLTKFETFLSSKRNYLGEVVAGSGLHRTKERTIDGGRKGLGTMDWALISALRTRHGLNKLRNASHFQGRNLLESDMKLYKSGRSTQWTQGLYNGARSVKIARTKDRNNSWPFAELGDSGSWIFREDGEVVGMLLGAFERQNVVFFIHIDDILSDIKDVTGSVDVRITD
ncbi:hypothetical protein BO82DRAFT_382206 [Aspergillus uvarum CBS 121591]|uniref:Uncharacterized protein n=1 Tax=Aspergillus uvarum CBS 121591 TaxID=1448315 RepID=A0A319CDF3_9EURO|nr:hypothetical protein BO82DRAFT_382206 [Aspergillus uvarum CBS 121591]PYH83705.1 hypothetical protein BO82DRAFT_382206 [Aspergillus uvarum CBS 121591]